MVALKLSSLMLVALAILPLASPVDRSKFRTCDQSAFCKRCRNVADAGTTLGIDPSTLTVSDSRVEVVLVQNEVRFRLEIFGLVDSSYRVRIREAFPLVPRFEVPYVLDGEPKVSPFTVESKSDSGFTLVNAKDQTKVVLTASPFKIDFYSGDELTLTLNGKGQFR